MGLAFIDTGWWLNRSKDVKVDAKAEIRCVGDFYEIRNINANWVWNDIIDANDYEDWLDLETVTHNTIQPLSRFHFSISIPFKHEHSAVISASKAN